MSKEFKYIDIHSHLNFQDYDSDRDEVIARTKESGVAVINVGTDLPTSKSAIGLAEKNENMYATIGLHPTHTSEVFDRAAYLSLARHPKVVAIGECGLDYFRMSVDSSRQQTEVFEAMIDIANEVGKPLMLHIRNGSGKSAYKDAYEILKSRANAKGNLHFFAGSIEEAKPFLDLGYTFSFTGVITFTRDYDEVIKFLPADRIMSETDAPYVTPAPYRGKRNEPAFVIEIVKAIAKIRGVDEENVRLQILENAKRVFAI